MTKINQEDIMNLYLEYQEQYDFVFIDKICDEIFIYRPLGRKEYNELIAREDLSIYEKEDVICELCTLYPEDYDFDLVAGVVTQLTEKILNKSYLSLEDRQNLLVFYRQEMLKVDNQITCIIHEAFPEYEIDTISNFDVVTTSKYLALAEWKLTNLRNLSFNEEGPYAELLKQKEEINREQEEIKTEEVKLNKKGSKKEPLTPEKLEQLKRDFPDIDWENDSIEKYGPEVLNEYVDQPGLVPQAIKNRVFK